MKDELEADPALEEHRWCSREWTDLVVQRALDLEGRTRALDDDSGRIARVLRAYHRTFGAVEALAAANGRAIVEAASSLPMATPTVVDPASDGDGVTAPDAMAVDPPAGPDASSTPTATGTAGRTTQKLGVGSDEDGATAPEAMAVDPPAGAEGESAVLAEAAGAPRGGTDPAAAAAAGEKEPHAADADEKEPAGAVPVRAGAPAE
jgi:hypothetical protein